jgi:hypothetical protein
MIRRSYRASALLTAVVVVAATVGATASAGAVTVARFQPPSNDGREPRGVGTAEGSLVVQNTYGGFDPVVAQANGYTVAYDATGIPYGTKPGYVLKHDEAGVPMAVPPRAVTPGGMVTNSLDGALGTSTCGNTHIFFNAIGGRKADIRTGFSVGGTDGAAPAIFAHWLVGVTDANGSAIRDLSPGYNKSGVLPQLWAWETEDQTHDNHVGGAFAWVAAGSDIKLGNGTICLAHTPDDYTSIY